jgi:hypothetical protein
LGLVGKSLVTDAFPLLYSLLSAFTLDSLPTTLDTPFLGTTSNNFRLLEPYIIQVLLLPHAGYILASNFLSFLSICINISCLTFSYISFLLLTS